ncbi:MULTISPECIES: chemotaxis protein CheD [Geobacter]|uniref:Probable chemoreceptor glutamine deamidase CheD n=2 Tax=Geobacter TaxID=28231 RepID=A0A0C1TKQ2_9BACT|nr:MULTISPECIES: chemotaxis protein CheD [Geobacter]ANA39630.1 chemotaxis protein CheD [Geobacter anodireducens]KIE41404.1 chemotaxis protein CheD [Geobacter soli]MBE2888397.1 chemotaxis protein CheD [Geobacter anodireducens]HMN02005.1 chemotaxis protein CheD [Geobacter anodireducens]
MRHQRLEGRHIVRIAPGEYHVTTGGGVISTLLGSCVAACLFDPENGVAGMNHFLLSNRRYSRTMPFCFTEAGRYGIHSMELLINSLMRHGARRENLRAKAFGGASILVNRAEVGNFSCVGSVNARFVREFLANEGIPLLSADLEGERGRVIYFDTADFSVFVRKIRFQRSLVVAKRDRSVWEHGVRAHDEEPASVDLWLPG